MLREPVTSMQFVPRPRAWLSLLAGIAAVALVACDSPGKSPEPSPNPSPAPAPAPAPPNDGSGGTVVTGTERLAWLQEGPSASVVSGYRYTALVDGVRLALTGAQCATATGGGYDCRAPLPAMTPGRHVVALTAIDAAGQESGVSAPITLDVRPTVSVVAPGDNTTSPLEGGAGRTVDTGTTCTETAGQCFQRETVVENLTGPRRLRMLPGGRLLFLDGEARVLLLGDRTLSTALQLPQDIGGTLRIADIVPAPDFSTSRFVYAAIVRTVRAETVTDVVRFRENRRSPRRGGHDRTWRQERERCRTVTCADWPTHLPRDRDVPGRRGGLHRRERAALRS